jgi:hypothetical protein
MRAALLGFTCAALACFTATQALAKNAPASQEDGSGEQAAAKKDKKPRKNDAKSQKDAKAQKDLKNSKAAGKAEQVATFGDWGVYATQGRDRTCYAMSQPKDRQPSKLKRDPAYLFVSTRPGEGVRNEVAIMLGFATKDNGDPSADIDGAGYELVTKTQNAWVKDPAKEKEFVDSLKRGAKLTVKAMSSKGNLTTDVYSLKGISQALDRAAKECQ